MMFRSILLLIVIFVVLASPVQAQSPDIKLLAPQAGEAIALSESPVSIEVDLSQLDNIAWTTLYIDDRPIEENLVSPFNMFTLELSQFGPGLHTIRIEATTEEGATYVIRQELTIEETAPSPSSNLMMLVYIALGGMVILFIGGGGGIILVRNKDKIGTFAQRKSVRPEVDQEEDDTFLASFDPLDDTMLLEDRPPAEARLVAIEGLGLLPQNQFYLTKTKTSLGRNTNGTINDIDIQERSVSREHAQINFSEQKFTIQDNGSTYGTKIDGLLLEKFEEQLLSPGTVIEIGPRIKLKFELDSAFVN